MITCTIVIEYEIAAVITCTVVIEYEIDLYFHFKLVLVLH